MFLKINLYGVFMSAYESILWFFNNVYDFFLSFRSHAADVLNFPLNKKKSLYNNNKFIMVEVFI